MHPLVLQVWHQLPDLEEMMLERGVEVDHTTLYRWVQQYAPEMEKRLRWYYKPTLGESWRVNETYVKVKGHWKYLYRAITKSGDTVDFISHPLVTRKQPSGFLGRLYAR